MIDRVVRRRENDRSSVGCPPPGPTTPCGSCVTMVDALVLGATGTIPTATPSAAPTGSASPSPSGNTELQISTPNQGDGILFDTKQLTAAAGARVSLTYTKRIRHPA